MITTVQQRAEEAKIAAETETKRRRNDDENPNVDKSRKEKPPCLAQPPSQTHDDEEGESANAHKDIEEAIFHHPITLELLLMCLCARLGLIVLLKRMGKVNWEKRHTVYIFFFVFVFCFMFLCSTYKNCIWEGKGIFA